MDTFLLVASGVATAGIAWLGFRVSVRPVQRKEALRYEIGFVALAVIALVLLVWAGVRSGGAQDRLRAAVNAANRDSAAAAKAATDANRAATDANRAATEANAAAAGANREAAAARAEATRAKEEAQANRKELAEARASINANVDRYRTDTTSAVSRILRPPRTLTVQQRARLKEILERYGSHEIGIRSAQGSAEAQAFAAALGEAIKAAGWVLKPLERIRFLIFDQQGQGIVVMVGGNAGPQIQVADALTSALTEVGYPPTGRMIAPIEEGTVELYIALQ